MKTRTTPSGPNDKDETDTNVVWLFDSIASGSPGLDVGDYDGHLGRIWFSDELVDSVGGDVDSLFTIDDPDNPGTPLFTLDADIIKRIEAQDLSALLELNVPIDQRVEVTAFTEISGAEFEIDDPLVSLANLRIDFGGVTDIGNLELDNLLGPVNPSNPNFPGDDDFQTLTLNSFLANNDDHYLLPDSFDPDNNPLPSDTLQIVDPSNNIGDISSGADRGVLRDIVINTSATGEVGTDLNIQTVFFSDDGDTTSVGGTLGNPNATLDINGTNDVTAKAWDLSDADITALTTNTFGHTGTVLVTGGSPAVIGGDDDGDGNTEKLSFVNGKLGTGQVLLGHVFDAGAGEFVINENGSGDAYAGIDASTLSLIETYQHGGTVNLGVVADIDSEDFRISNDDDGADSDGIGADGAGVGTVKLCLGEGVDADGNVVSPELSATGRWEFDNGDAGSGVMELEIKDVTVNTGGELELDGVTLLISGDIDLTPLDVADLSVDDTTIEVAAGATLTLTVEQVTALQAGGINIFGEGKVEVTGESDDTDGDDRHRLRQPQHRRGRSVGGHAGGVGCR